MSASYKSIIVNVTVARSSGALSILNQFIAYIFYGCNQYLL